MQKHVQSYSINVRMGNWVEDNILQSEKTKLFLEKRNRGELLVQKTRKMYASLLQPVDLNTTDEYLRYGQVTQLVCPDVRFPGWCTPGVSLSCSVSDSHPERDGLGLGCKMTASPLSEPCVRNCFKIQRTESGYENGNYLKFGDTFFISPCDSSKTLFVTAVMPRLYTARGLSGHPELKLTDGLDTCCRWTVDYWNPSLQMEAKGLPIPSDARVILKHTATHQNVAVEKDLRLSTFFGSEYEVSIHSYKDFRGCDKEQNIWQFITNNPKSDTKGTDENK